MCRRVERIAPIIMLLACAAPLLGQQPPPQPTVNVPPAATPASGTDDRYRFAAGMSDEQEVALERTPAGVRFTWPRTSKSWDTALLGVRSWGAEAEPWD